MTSPPPEADSNAAPRVRSSSRDSALDLRMPIRASALAVVMLAASGWLAIGATHFDEALEIADARVCDQSIRSVHQGGGTIAKVLVASGQRVSAGDLLATIETAGDIDAEIAELRSKSSSTQVRLESARRETQAFNAMLEQRLVARARVAELETRLAELERESAAVLRRIDQAEQRHAQVEIRAPASGMITSTTGLVVGRAAAPGEAVAEIASDPDRLMLEAQLGPGKTRTVRPGAAVRVWLGAESWRDPNPLSARIAWVSPTDHTAHIELLVPPERRGQLAIPTHRLRASVALRAGSGALLSQLLDPIRRAAGSTRPI